MKFLENLWGKIQEVIEKIMRPILNAFHVRWDEIKWSRFFSFTKFCFVGLTSAVVMYLTYVVLFLGIHNYFVANIFGFLTSTTNSFFWNRTFVFKNKDKTYKNMISSYLKTMVIYAITGFIISNILLYIWVEKVNISSFIAPLINIVIVTPLNYILNKVWAFSDKKR